MARRGYAQHSNGLWLNNKANELMDTDPRAFCMWIMSLSYASDNMTDGLLNVRALRRLGCDDRTRDTLIACGMWEDSGDGCVHIHDYLEHNMSRAFMEESRAKAAAKKRRQRGTSPHLSPGTSHGTSPGTDAGTERGTFNQNQNQKDISNEISPPVCPPHEGDTQNALFDDPSEPSKPKRKRRAKTTLPDDWKPTAKHQARALEMGADLPVEATKFTNWAVSNAKTYADWDRAFDNWLLNSKKYEPSKTDWRSPSRSQMNLEANMANTWKYMTDEEKARFQGGGFHAFQG